MKKRAVIAVLLAVMSVMCVFGLSACGNKLEGTYTVYNTMDSNGSTFENSLGTITFSATGAESNVSVLSIGKISYSLNGNKLTLTSAGNKYYFEKDGEAWVQYFPNNSNPTFRMVLRKKTESKSE